MGVTHVKGTSVEEGPVLQVTCFLCGTKEVAGNLLVCKEGSAYVCCECRGQSSMWRGMLFKVMGHHQAYISGKAGMNAARVQWRAIRKNTGLHGEMKPAEFAQDQVDAFAKSKT